MFPLFESVLKNEDEIYQIFLKRYSIFIYERYWGSNRYIQDARHTYFEWKQSDNIRIHNECVIIQNLPYVELTG